MKKWLIMILLLMPVLTGCRGFCRENVDAKPVIYLYPEEETAVSVKLDYAGTLTATYPAYHDGWNVIAQPDGTLTDSVTGRQYYCLFWEGTSDTQYDFSQGFVVPGVESATFLEWALEAQGLTEREANEFIIFWLPKLEGNAYNLISFQQECYTEAAKLTVEPKPDTVIRVFMAFKALKEPVDVPEQELTAMKRSGFTLVEWGGCEVTE